VLKIEENLWAVGAPPRTQPHWRSSQRSPDRTPLAELTSSPDTITGGEGLLTLPKNPSLLSAFCPSVLAAPNKNPEHALALTMFVVS